MKKCDIVIPVWNELESTRKCINALRDNTRYPYRLIAIDNGSQEPTREYLEGLKEIFPDFLLIRNNVNLGFVKAVNQGIIASLGLYICLLNNDAYVTENWLKDLIETAEAGPENIGIANPTSNVFGKVSRDGKKYQWQELDSCKGFCMLIKREVIKKIGLFDEIYGMGYFEEKDFCRRAIEAGYTCVRAKASFVFHKDKLSFDKLKERDRLFKKNENIYNKKWGRPLNIAFVAKRKDDLINRQEIIYTLLKKGHRMHIFFGRKETVTNLKDHINIRYFPIPDTLFGYIILFKLWERHRKKIEIIVSGDKDILKFFDRFKFLHHADVLNNNSDVVVSFCKVKSYE